MDSLLPELRILVFSFLNLFDITRAQFVSKQWNTDAWAGLSRVDLPPDTPRPGPVPLPFHPRPNLFFPISLSPFLLKFQSRRIVRLDCSFVLLDDLGDLVALFPNLTSLSLSTYLPSIAALYKGYSYRNLDSLSDLEKSVLSPLNRLVSLSISSDCRPGLNFSQLENLEWKLLKRIPSTSISEFHSFFLDCTKLRSLKISEDVPPLSNLSSLTSLSFSLSNSSSPFLNFSTIPFLGLQSLSLLNKSSLPIDFSLLFSSLSSSGLVSLSLQHISEVLHPHLLSSLSSLSHLSLKRPTQSSLDQILSSAWGPSKAKL